MSLGGKTVRALLKGANDGAGPRRMADLKKVGQMEGAAPPAANRNTEPPGVTNRKSAKIMRLLELVDAGDQFALNKFARAEFGQPWTKLKKESWLKDML